MKIQAVRNNTTTSNYQANNSKQQSFGVGKLDRRGVSFLSPSQKRKLLAGYLSVHKEVGELMRTKNVDVLVHPVQRKKAPAGVMILRPLKSGRIKQVFMSINDHDFASSLAQAVKNALTKTTPAHGTFAEAAIKKPQPAHLWDTALELPVETRKDRFAAVLA